MGDIDMTEDLKLKVGELTERGDFGRGIIRSEPHGGCRAGQEADEQRIGEDDRRLK